MNPIIINYAIILLFIVAAICWAIAGNWLQVLYWLAGAMLNVAVTIMAGQA